MLTVKLILIIFSLLSPINTDAKELTLSIIRVSGSIITMPTATFSIKDL